METIKKESVIHTHRVPDWRELPESVAGDYRAIIERYLEGGIPPGGFMTALLSNQLTETVLRADNKNLKILKAWVSFVHWEIGYDACGSEDKVKSHIRRGGYQCAKNK